MCIVNPAQEAIVTLRDRGWTLAAVADALGVHQVSVARWLAGHRYPNNATAVLLALHGLQRRKPPVRGRGGRPPKLPHGSVGIPLSEYVPMPDWMAEQFGPLALLRKPRRRVLAERGYRESDTRQQAPQ